MKLVNKWLGGVLFPIVPFSSDCLFKDFAKSLKFEENLKMTPR